MATKMKNDGIETDRPTRMIVVVANGLSVSSESSCWIDAKRLGFVCTDKSSFDSRSEVFAAIFFKPIRFVLYCRHLFMHVIVIVF